MQNPKLKTVILFSGSAQDGSKAGILCIKKVTLEGGLVAYFEVGMSEDEIRSLRDTCNRRLEESTCASI